MRVVVRGLGKSARRVCSAAMKAARRHPSPDLVGELHRGLVGEIGPHGRVPSRPEELEQRNDSRQDATPPFHQVRA